MIATNPSKVNQPTVNSKTTPLHWSVKYDSQNAAEVTPAPPGCWRQCELCVRSTNLGRQRRPSRARFIALSLGGKKVKLQIWDTAHDHGAQGIVLVYAR